MPSIRTGYMSSAIASGWQIAMAANAVAISLLSVFIVFLVVAFLYFSAVDYQVEDLVGGRNYMIGISLA